MPHQHFGSSRINEILSEVGLQPEARLGRAIKIGRILGLEGDVGRVHAGIRCPVMASSFGVFPTMAEHVAFANVKAFALQSQHWSRLEREVWVICHFAKEIGDWGTRSILWRD